MKELIIENKQKYLEEHYPFVGKIKLTDKKRCIHCDTIITVGDFKVFQVFQAKDGFEFICCPNAPDCDGTVIDWIELY